MYKEYDDYSFMDEVRDGFLIESRMKRLWASDMRDLEILRYACDSSGVKFSLAGGSLLGAIRNGGHIPWDDDMDVEMRRKDYHKACDDGLLDRIPEPYWISDHRYYGNGYQLVKLVNSHSYNLTEEERENHFGSEFANMIDIFFLDYIPEDEEVRKLFFKIVEICEIIRADQKNDPILYPENYKNRKEQVTKLFGYEIETEENETIDSIILRYLDDFFLEQDEINSSDMALLYFYFTEKKYVYPKKLYDRYFEIEYENTTVWVPAGYDGILRRNFGDYMFPAIGTAFHDYPCYTYNIRKMKENGLEYRSYHIKQELCLKSVTDNHSGINDKKAVFVCLHADDWKGLDRLCLVMIEGGWDVRVVVVPYKFFDYRGNLSGEEISEINSFPEHIKDIICGKYCFEKERPGVVIYQWPYDEYNYAINISDQYYISNIRKYAGKMVLIPPFILRDIGKDDICSRYGLGTWVKTPGFMSADLIVAQSENMKAVMEEIVKSFFDAEGIPTIGWNWSDRIVNTGNPLMDIPKEKDFSSISQEYMERIIKNDGTYRKILLFYTSASVVYEHGLEALKKGMSDMGLICSYENEITVWWVLDPHMDEIVFSDGEMMAVYESWLDDYRYRDNVIIDSNMDVSKLANICDGFFGDGCHLMNEVRIQKKPVFWETPKEYMRNRSLDGMLELNEDVVFTIEGEWDVCSFINEFLRYNVLNIDSNIVSSIFDIIKEY